MLRLGKGNTRALFVVSTPQTKRLLPYISRFNARLLIVPFAFIVAFIDEAEAATRCVLNRCFVLGSFAFVTLTVLQMSRALESLAFSYWSSAVHSSIHTCRHEFSKLVRSNTGTLAPSCSQRQVLVVAVMSLVRSSTQERGRYCTALDRD